MGFRFSDPCKEDMYIEHLREQNDCKLEALTQCGEYTRDHLRLNRPDLLRWRSGRRTAAERTRLFKKIKQDFIGLLDSAMDAAVQAEIRKKIEAIEDEISHLRQEFSLADP